MELSNKHIIILSTAKFDGPYESTSYTIAKLLARKNNVYYIENPYTLKDYLKQTPKDAFLKRKSKFSYFSNGVIQTKNPRFKIIITPPLLSIHFLNEGWLYRTLLRINEKIIATRIKQIIKNEKIDNYIFFNSFNFHYPNTIDFVNKKPSLSIYQTVDPLASEYDRKHGLISEEIIVTKSNLILGTSMDLVRKKKDYNPNTYFVPNAVDLSHASLALNPDVAIHEKIIGLTNKPIIGYFGNIERRMDFDLLKEVIERCPDYNFVFAGPLGMEYIPEWFMNTENVYLPGYFEYKDMPAVVKGFDVCMIPFKSDENSRSIFPLKLFEYLAAGKPTLATNFNPDLKSFTEKAVIYASTVDNFIQGIKQGLENNNESQKQYRLAIAAQNTWEKRVSEIETLISEQL